MPLVLLLCKSNLGDDALSVDRVMWFNTKSISSVTVDHVVSGRAEELMRSPGKYPPDAFVYGWKIANNAALGQVIPSQK